MHVLRLSKKRSCVAHFSSFWSILEQMTCKFLASKFQVASHNSSQSPNLKLNNVNSLIKQKWSCFVIEIQIWVFLITHDRNMS